MSDSAKYFGTQKRGEIFELKEELLVSDIAKKRDAVKKVIAAMTVGKDVSSLFTDVLNCMMTSNVEIKKLVYLYIMNYASSNPDLCILAVNAFVKDAGDMANPMLRALSVRTMGCIRVEKITEYLCEPLRKCLKDEDPYVRKTAAVCVAKLYDISPDLVEVQGFLDDLRRMLGDSNPMVVANSVAALSEIAESGKADAFEVTHTILQKLLAALNECTEWGQVFILDALAFYTPSDEREAESIIDRVSPRLQHANSAVVLSSTKVILHNLDSISNNDIIKAVTKKLAPPLVTLLSSESEIQYVALRNINLIVQKRPSILSHEVKVFFCKYNDPIYVKMEKLEIMVMLASERNVEQVLLEFKEYATEVDVEFVRRSVRAIGRCAIKLEGAAERCINVLLDLITTKVNYVVQEAIVVIKDIFRKYPNRYEAIIGTLCENLDTLDEPEAKASMIWIIGEYAERIDNAGELMEQFLETFADESISVQLQLLTATVKLFLKQPNGTQEMVQRVLQLATQGSDNPDLRDRGFVYWRLLSTDPEAAKAVVLAEKPTINDDSGQLAPDILDQLLKHLSTLASVYHRLPETFVSRVKIAAHRDDDDDEEDGSSHHAAPATHSQAAPKAAGGGAAAPPPKQVDLMSDLFGDGPAAPVASATVSRAAAPAASLLDDLMGGFGAPAPSAPSAALNLPVICSAQQGKGMEVKGHLVRRGGETVYDVVISNQTQQPLNGFAIQFNKNLFSIMPGTIPSITGTTPLPSPPMHARALPPQRNPLPAVNPGQSVPTSFAVKFGDASQAQAPGPAASQLQIALKNNVGVNYFSDNVSLHSVFTENAPVDQGPFLQEWKSLESVEVAVVLKGVSGDNVDDKAQRLRAANVYQVARRRNEQGYEELYTTSRCGNGAHVLCMLVFAPGKGCRCSARSSVAGLAALMMPSLETILA